MGEVRLPVVGKVKSGWVTGAVVVVAVIVGYAYYKHRGSSTAAAAAGTAASSSTAAAGIDPATGYPYGSAEDQAALAQMSAGGSYGSSYDPYGAGSYYGYGYGTGTGLNGYTANSGPGTFTDNAYWLQYCEQQMTGYSPGQIQAALSAYLAGVQLTSAQYAIYQQALGVGGPPPNPPATPNPPPPPPPPPPHHHGGHVSPQVSGLRAEPGVTDVKLSWAREPGATGYRITVVHGGQVTETETVQTSAATISGLRPRTQYHFHVQALPSASSAYADVTATTR